MIGHKELKKHKKRFYSLDINFDLKELNSACFSVSKGAFFHR
jgi:hypothetical protein